MTIDRKKALLTLIRLNGPIKKAMGNLPNDWADSPELVQIGRHDVVRLLSEFLAGRLSAEEVALWAEALEVRDDVGREQDERRRINGFLFELANPAMNGRLTTARAREWLVEFGDD